MKTPGQILHEAVVKVYDRQFSWRETALDVRDKYEKVARLFLFKMKKSTPAAKPSK